MLVTESGMVTMQIGRKRTVANAGHGVGDGDGLQGRTA